MVLISRESPLPLLAQAPAATHPLSVCMDLSVLGFRMNGIMQRGPFRSAFLHLANVTRFVPLSHVAGLELCIPCLPPKGTTGLAWSSGKLLPHVFI